MTKYILVLLLILSGTATNSQIIGESCGTPIPGNQWEIIFSQMINEFRAQQTRTSRSRFVEYTIPVIFHVIHSGQNIGSFPNI